MEKLKERKLNYWGMYFFPFILGKNKEEKCFFFLSIFPYLFIFSLLSYYPNIKNYFYLISFSILTKLALLLLLLLLLLLFLGYSNVKINFIIIFSFT